MEGEAECDEHWSLEKIEETMKKLDENSTAKEQVDLLSKFVGDKSELEFEEDFFSMTIFSYLKSNSKVWDKEHGFGWGIKAEKQA